MRKLKKLLKERAKNLTKISALLALMVVGSVIGPDLHRKALRSHVSSAVVKLTNKSGNSGGTGFHVNLPSGQKAILTNMHVCKLQDKSGLIWVSQIKDGNERRTQRKVIEESNVHDLCIVEAISQREHAISVGSASDIGDYGYVLGHPRLRPKTLSFGEYVGEAGIQINYGQMPKEKCIGTMTKISKVKLPGLYCVARLHASLYNLSIEPGNSGSPIVNMAGRLVGVAFAGNPSNTFESYMVPHRFIVQFLEGK